MFPAGAGVIPIVLCSGWSVFPAGAGVILPKILQISTMARVSRRRGGDPEVNDCLNELLPCFPQARG